jgi:hypothetical protein
MAPKDPRLPDSPFIPRQQQTPNSGGPNKSAKMARLDALFKGGGVPAKSPHAPSAGAMGARMRTERLRGARSVEEIALATDSLLNSHEMPDEPELLCKMLQHPDAAVGERALAQLGSLKRAGKLELNTTVREALDAFDPRCKEPLARNLLAELRETR